jgi:DEAD/DEAH box helicase domain-containing protein
VPGGVGFAERCHERYGELLATAVRIVDGCECAAGCPSCTGPAPEGVHGRVVTRRLLDIALASIA